MLLKIRVRNAKGDIDLDTIHNDAEARRIMVKAIEKGAEFSVTHHKTVMPPMYTFAEMEAAWAKAFEAGREAAMNEMESSTAPSKAPAKQSKK
jgi:hypothetical protein